MRVFGISPRDFWQMTPIEFWWAFEEEKELGDVLNSEWLEEMETKVYGKDKT